MVNMKKLKCWNIGDWRHRGGRLFVCASSMADAVRACNEAYSKVHQCKDPCAGTFTVVYFKDYASPAWGNNMEGITPERGVWWSKSDGRGMYVHTAERII